MNLQELLQELRTQNISEKILKFIEIVDRKDFVPKKYKSQAYENIPLPLNHNSTISQPYTVAFMLQESELKPGLKVLEIGAGSGYNAALISKIVGSKGKVYTIEISEALVKTAKNNLKNFRNAKIIHGDGSIGLKEKAPFDRIIQTAATKKTQPALIKQLKTNGIYIAPVGPKENQKLVKTIKYKSGIKQFSLGDFIFVPLTTKTKTTETKKS